MGDLNDENKENNSAIARLDAFFGYYVARDERANGNEPEVLSTDDAG
jgi:hypothetical protein